MAITLTIGGRDFSSRISTYTVEREVTYRKVVKTLSGKEKVYGRQSRPIVTFTLLPYTGSDCTSDYSVLSGKTMTVVFTDPNTNSALTKTMRVVSNLSSVFLLNSVNGSMYYKGGKIQLRSTTVD